MSENTTNKDPGRLQGGGSRLCFIEGAQRKHQGCAPCCPGAFPSWRCRQEVFRCLPVVYLGWSPSSAVACRPKLNAQMTPPSNPCAQQLLERLHNRAALRVQLFLSFHLFCVKHSGWGVRPLLSLKRFSDSSQREKFLLQHYDKSRLLPFGSSLKSSTDLVMRLQEIYCRCQIFVSCHCGFWPRKEQPFEKPSNFAFAFPRHRMVTLFFPLFNSCLGNLCAKFYPIVMPFWHGQNPLALRRARQPWLLWMGIYDQVSFYIHLAQVYSYRWRR